MSDIEQFILLTKQMADTYSAKNSDYGSSFTETYKKFGLIAPIVRMHDKLGRVSTLTTRAQRVRDESIEDTLLDLAAYAIMSVIELRRDKPSTTEPFRFIPEPVRGAIGPLTQLDGDQNA